MASSLISESEITQSCPTLCDPIDRSLPGSSVHGIFRANYWSGLPFHRWEKVEGVTEFLFLGSKITVDGDCRHKIRRRLLPGRKVMTNLDSVLKSRDITLPTKVCIVKAMVFPVVTYSCESWTIKKAERQRTDALDCVAGEDS